MLTIYHAPGTRSIRVLWLCHELDIPHEVKTIPFASPYRASPEYRALNPVGKVPAMTDGAFTMFESGAMVQYLLDRHGRRHAVVMMVNHPEAASSAAAQDALMDWLWAGAP